MNYCNSLLTFLIFLSAGAIEGKTSQNRTSPAAKEETVTKKSWYRSVKKFIVTHQKAIGIASLATGALLCVGRSSGSITSFIKLKGWLSLNSPTNRTAANAGARIERVADLPNEITALKQQCRNLQSQLCTIENNAQTKQDELIRSKTTQAVEIERLKAELESKATLIREYQTKLFTMLQATENLKNEISSKTTDAEEKVLDLHQAQELIAKQTRIIRQITAERDALLRESTVVPKLRVLEEQLQFKGYELLTLQRTNRDLIEEINSILTEIQTKVNFVTSTLKQNSDVARTIQPTLQVLEKLQKMINQNCIKYS